MVKTVSTVFSGDRSPEGSVSSRKSLYPCSTVRGVRRSWEKAAFRRFLSSTTSPQGRGCLPQRGPHGLKDWHSRPISSELGDSTWESKSFWAIFERRCSALPKAFLIFHR